MELELYHYLLICPLVFLGGFVDSVAGGGGLITLPTYFLAGIPTHIAAGTNKVVNGIGTATASVRYLKSGKVDLSIALPAAAGALVGSAAGARLALLLSDALLKGLMLVALPLVAVFLMVKKDFGLETGDGPVVPPLRKLALSLLIGFFIGGYDGLVGPGTGTFMIMAFTALLHRDLISASGCAKVGNLASNIAAAVVYLLSGKVLWAVVLPAALCNALGGWCGARYAIRGGSRRVRGMIFLVLGMLFVKMLWDLLL